STSPLTFSPFPRRWVTMRLSNAPTSSRSTSTPWATRWITRLSLRCLLCTPVPAKRGPYVHRTQKATRAGLCLVRDSGFVGRRVAHLCRKCVLLRRGHPAAGRRRQGARREVREGDCGRGRV